MSHLITVCVGPTMQSPACGAEVEGAVLWMSRKEAGSNVLHSSRKLLLHCHLAAEMTSLKLLVDSNGSDWSNN